LTAVRKLHVDFLASLLILDVIILRKMVVTLLSLSPAVSPN
jgi:hypothetical protein